MPIPPLSNGVLPMGRWVCTPQEVHDHFVRGLSIERADIWTDWEDLVGVLRSVVGRVPAAWLSGSFLSSKPVPGDMDSVFLIDTKHLAVVLQANSVDAQVLALLASGQAKAQLGLNVDSYILQWDPRPGPQDDASDEYYRYRGYWDDLWVRQRDPDPRLDSIPRRGFLEVIIDGYE